MLTAYLFAPFYPLHTMIVMPLFTMPTVGLFTPNERLGSKKEFGRLYGVQVSEFGGKIWKKANNIVGLVRFYAVANNACMDTGYKK